VTPDEARAAHLALRLRTRDPAELARAACVSIAVAVRALAVANAPHDAVVLRPAEVREVVRRA
jgi:hypothetical protein